MLFVAFLDLKVELAPVLNDLEAFGFQVFPEVVIELLLLLHTLLQVLAGPDEVEVLFLQLRKDLVELVGVLEADFLRVELLWEVNAVLLDQLLELVFPVLLSHVLPPLLRVHFVEVHPRFRLPRLSIVKIGICLLIVRSENNVIL